MPMLEFPRLIADADADADVWLKGLMTLSVWQDSGAF